MRDEKPCGIGEPAWRAMHHIRESREQLQCTRPSPSTSRKEAKCRSCFCGSYREVVMPDERPVMPSGRPIELALRTVTDVQRKEC